MEAEVFRVSVNDLYLNLPSNVSSFMPSVRRDLQRQIEYYTGATASLARKCRERTGEEIGYIGMHLVHSSGLYQELNVSGSQVLRLLFGISTPSLAPLRVKTNV
jgi:hypothetical protein